ncbi:hypothetical protein ABTL30_20380, partial [Acinetobacter baumannii]
EGFGDRKPRLSGGMGMTIIIGILAALLLIFVLVALVKIAFGLIVLGAAVVVAVVAYRFAERLMGRGA